MTHPPFSLPPASVRRWRRMGLAALAAIALAGCESRSHFTLAPPLAAEAVPAIARPQPGGAQEIVIAEAARLPAEVLAARDLKVSIQGRLLHVARRPTGALAFTIPAGLSPTEAKDGQMTLLFVMDDRASRLLTINTGSPIAFAADPVALEGDGRVPAGMTVALAAATDAPEADYDFAWSFGPSADGPWQAIAAAGKRIHWTPTAPGAYFLRIEATERTRQASHVAITSTPRLRVIEPDALFSIAGASAVDRGQSVSLGFALPGDRDAALPHAWSVGPGPQGPWTPITGKDRRITWMPTLPGSYHLRVDVNGLEGASSFVSTRPLVTVHEGRPIITPSLNAAIRGERIDLTLDLPEAGAGPFSWFAARPGDPWRSIPGSAAVAKFLPDQPGAYNFRVDMPLADGTVRTFQTTDPILTVAETTNLFTTSPFPATTRPGDSVSLQINARGVADTSFHYVWYVSANPAAMGWTPLTLKQPEDIRRPGIRWELPATQPAGSYYVRADAVEDATGHVYTFVSTTPLVFVTLSD